MIVVDADRGIDEGLAGMLMRAAAAAGVTYNGPTPAEIRSERDRLLREQAEKEDAEIRSERERLLREQAEKEDAEFVLAMQYACPMMQENLDNGKRNSNS